MQLNGAEITQEDEATMCINYRPPTKEDLQRTFAARVGEQAEWPNEIWQDYPAPIIRAGADGTREASVASFGMVPKRHIPQGVKPWSSMNARTDFME